MNSTGYWLAAGAVLTLLFILLNIISRNFAAEIPLSGRPVLLLVSILIISGIVYLFILRLIPSSGAIGKLLFVIIATGFVMRVAMIFSTPMLEDDYFRYLWDGAVVSHGYNVYGYSPEEVLGSGESENPDLIDLKRLAGKSGTIVTQINHPHIRTIYPPITQLAFALAHRIQPWSLIAWRFILLCTDISILFLIIAFLKILHLSFHWLAIYWWNPLLIKEIYNSGHMDIIVFPFLLAAIIFAVREKYMWGAGFLGLAAGVKFWPVILLPVILRPLLQKPGKLILSLLLFTFIAGLLFLPIYLNGFDENSAIDSYGRRWELNDSLFKLIVWSSEYVLPFMDIHPGHGQYTARWVILIFTLLWTVWVIRHKPVTPAGTLYQCLLIVAAVFLLSPTQFPWYYSWILIFLTFVPKRSLMLLTVLLPLYYCRYYFETAGSVEIFDNGIVWLEFIPVWYLLFTEWRSRNKLWLQPQPALT